MGFGEAMAAGAFVAVLGLFVAFGAFAWKALKR